MEVKKKIILTSLVALLLLTGCKNDKGALPEKEAAKIELQDTKFLDEMENKTTYIDYKLSEFTPSLEDYKVAEDFWIWRFYSKTKRNAIKKWIRNY